VTVKAGGNFNISEEIGFKFIDFCTNEECNDNIATYDICISNASTCIYIPKDCEKYGALFGLNITTDDKPRETK